MTPRIYQAVAIAAALRTYAKTGMQVNTAYTPAAMLRTAANITGKQYKRVDLVRAADDLTAWAEEQTPRTYRLGSNDAVSAPGMVAWAINGAAFEGDRPTIIKVVCDAWGIPEHAAQKLVTKAVPFTVEDETVVFTA